MNLMDELEGQAITIIREVVLAARRPVVLFSGGKDSAVLVRLVQMAFFPEPAPVTLLHIDTGHNFPETMTFIREVVEESRLPLIRAEVQEWIDRGRLTEVRRTGRLVSRNRLQSRVLVDVITEQGFDVALGGARRDEDRARAKEHLVSVRKADGSWDPLEQSPEPWGQVCIAAPPGGHARAFPLSDWTEIDVWNYIVNAGVRVPDLYFMHRRALVQREGRMFAVTDAVPARTGETPTTQWCRFRTVGDVTCTTAVMPRPGRPVSFPASPIEVLEDLYAVNDSERAGRADDDGDAAMEDRKVAGYF